MLNYFKIGKLSQKAGFVGFSKLILSLNSFFINIILARMLTKELNGSYQQTLLVVNMLSMIFIFGVPTSIYYYFPKLNDREKKGFLIQSVFILIFFGLLTSSVLFFLSDWISLKFNNPILPSILKISCIYLFFFLASSFSDAIFITINRHKLMALLTIIFTILHFSSVVIPVCLKKSLHTVFVLLGFVTALKFFICFFVSNKLTSKQTPIFSKLLFIQQISYIIPLGLNSVIDVLSKELDRTLVSLLFKVEELANYHYGAMEIPLIGILISSITAVLIPELSKFREGKKWEDFAGLFRNATIKTAIIIFPLFGLLMILAPQVFSVLFTDAYLPGVPIFRIYLFMLPIRIVSFQAILFALGKTKTVMFGAILDLLANFTLSVILVGYFGQNGIAMGLVIATICQALFYLYVIKSTIQISWKKLLDLKAFLQIITACVFGCIPCLLFSKITLPSIIQLVLSGLAFSITYLLTLRFVFKK